MPDTKNATQVMFLCSGCRAGVDGHRKQKTRPCGHVFHSQQVGIGVLARKEEGNFWWW